MDVASLKAHIKANTVPNFLIFAGDEWAVQKIYVEQIKKVTGLECRYIDSVTDILSKLKTKSVVNKSALYLVRDDKELMTNEKLQHRVESILGKNILILFITRLDKRTKYYSSHKESIIEFEALPPTLLVRYIQKQIDLSIKNCESLVGICESSYGRILLEIDKIKNWREAYIKDKAEPIPYDGAFLRLLNEGIIYKPPQDAIFDLVDMILQRNIEKSIELLQECYANGEATMVILSVLFNNAKAVLQVQECRRGDIAKTTGLSGWQIMNAKKVVGHYKFKELVKMLRKIEDVETGIKTGQIEEKFAVEYLLLEVM